MDSKSSEVAKWLIALKSQMTNLTEKTNLLPLVTKIAEKVMADHLSILVALDHQQGLSRLFDTYAAQPNDPKVTNKMEIIYTIGSSCLISKSKKYDKGRQILRDRMKSVQQVQKYLSKEDHERYLQMNKLLNELYSIKDKIDGKVNAREIIKQFMDFISTMRLYQHKSLLEQIFEMWVKRQIEKIQFQLYRELVIKETGLCCRVHFSQSESVHGINPSIEVPISSKEKGKILEKNSYFINHFQKCAVSFLNHRGGVIYLGIQSDGKKSVISGLSLTQEERKQLLQVLLEEVFNKIYPSCDLDQADKPTGRGVQQQPKRDPLQDIKKPLSQVNYEYPLNRYTSVEFIPLYNPQTLLYSRQNNEIVTYAVRIKIRPGSPYELYHYINNYEVPQTCSREGVKEKITTFKQFYEQFYRKAKIKAQDKSRSMLMQLSTELHQFCRLFEDPATHTRQ